MSELMEDVSEIGDREGAFALPAANMLEFGVFESIWHWLQISGEEFRI